MASVVIDMINAVIESLDGPAILISFTFLILVWRAFVALNTKLIELVMDSTKAMVELEKAFVSLREEIRRESR